MLTEITLVPTEPVGRKLVVLFRDTPIVNFLLGNGDIISYRIKKTLKC